MRQFLTNVLASRSSWAERLASGGGVDGRRWSQRPRQDEDFLPREMLMVKVNILT